MAYPTTSVGGIYALRKAVSGYAGSAIRVLRESDSTEQDIGFSGSALDTTSLTSFLGGSNGYVSKWYDQSGAAHDLAQATTTAQPRLIQNGLGEWVVRFSNTVKNTASAMYLESGAISLTARAFSGWIVGRNATGASGVHFGLTGYAGGSAQLRITNNASSVPGLAAVSRVSSLRAGMHKQLMGVVSGATACVLHNEGASESAAAVTSGTGTTLTLGKFSTTFGKLDAYEVAFYTAEQSSSDVTATKAEMVAAHALAAPTKLLLTDGDSITAGRDNTLQQSCPFIATESLSGWATVNLAASGSTLSSLDGRRPVVKLMWNAAMSRNALAFMVGVNDFTGATTAAAEYTALVSLVQNYLADAAAVGVTPEIYVGTLIGNSNATVQAKIDEYNQRIRGTNGYTGIVADAGATAVIDYGAVTHFVTATDAANTTYYGDGTHPTDAGAALLAPSLANALTPVAASLSYSPSAASYAAGATVTVSATGTGWAAGDDVSIDIIDSGGNPTTVAAGVVDADGGFSIDATIPADASGSGYYFHAVDSQTSDTIDGPTFTVTAATSRAARNGVAVGLGI